jgi:hypothetical protein
VQPRRRNSKSKIGIGIPNSQSRIHPVAPIIPAFSFDFM